MKKIFIFFLMASLSLNAQKVMNERNELILKGQNDILLSLKNKNIKKCIKYIFYDKKGIDIQKAGVIYLDSSFCVKKNIIFLHNTIEVTYVRSDSIFDLDKIKKVESFINEFDDIPKGDCVHYPPKKLAKPEKWKLPSAPSVLMPPMVKTIKYSRYEWEFWVYQGSYNEIDFNFKYRLFNFKCISIFNNIKARKKINKFIRDVEL